MENALLLAFITTTSTHMQGSANAAGNLGYKGELCNYTAVATPPGSAMESKNLQTVLANGPETTLKKPVSPILENNQLFPV